MQNLSYLMASFADHMSNKIFDHVPPNLWQLSKDHMHPLVQKTYIDELDEDKDYFKEY